MFRPSAEDRRGRIDSGSSWRLGLSLEEGDLLVGMSTSGQPGDLVMRPARRVAPPRGLAARTSKGLGMAVGTVKFFNAEKGYGFVSRTDGDDVFVHYSNVAGTGFRTLEAGQQVEFEIAAGQKGDEARNVKVI
jgi:cold shock protein